MKPLVKSTKPLRKRSDVIHRGLIAHRAATKSVYQQERRMGIRRDPKIISAIREKAILKFVYNGEPRVVEPQTYGLSTTGKEVLRGYQTGGGSRAGGNRLAKLFDVSKIVGMEKTPEHFNEALAVHNPDDSAMIEVFATLARGKAKKL